MPDGLITSRPLQNEMTGLDLQVPLYQEVRGAMMAGHVEYQIIVVTRLAAFKSPRHKAGDTVQLVVSKTYSEIDEFYYRLAAQYPKTYLPPMPRKAIFVGESDLRERRAVFDELVKSIAKSPTLAACPEVLEFLGAKYTEADVKTKRVVLGEEPDEEEDAGDDDFFQEDAVPVPRAVPVLRPHAAHGGEEDEGEEPFLGPLGNTKTKKKAKALPLPKALKKASLFGDDDPSDTDLFRCSSKDGDVKLFEDPDLGGTVMLGDCLLLPAASPQAGAPGGLVLDEDTDELFRVEDDFDKLLRVTKRTKHEPQLKPKPPLKPKPRPAVSPLSPAVNPLRDQMDILQYIQQNESNDHEDLF